MPLRCLSLRKWLQTIFSGHSIRYLVPMCQIQGILVRQCDVGIAKESATLYLTNQNLYGTRP